MTTEVERYISENRFKECLEHCESNGLPRLGKLLSKMLEINTKGDRLRIMLLCNWTNSKSLCDTWNKMSKGNYTWNKLQIVWDDIDVDYYVVINCPPINFFPPTEKTILFRMEPHMDRSKYQWGDWSNPKREMFLFAGFHDTHYNNNEWHISKTYQELKSSSPEKTVLNILSTLVSDKYKDPGHVKRIDFLKFLQEKGMTVHHFGGNKFGWKNYKGQLPLHQKDDALIPYKYTFNVENHSIPNYYTEKLIDGILSECLTFYSGCPNIKEHIDCRAYVYLELGNFEKDFQTIKRAIEEDWWSERITYIRRAKEKILEERQFFPRLEKIIREHEEKNR